MQKLADTYVKLFNKKPINILEIGSRDGIDIETLRLFLGIDRKNVYIAEPNPICAYNIKTKYKEFNVYDYAIADKEGTVDFNAVLSKDNMYIGQSSLLKRVLKYKQTGTNWINGDNWIKVNSITGKSFLELIKEPVDLIKIDVEGYAYEVIKSFDDKLMSVNLIQVECEYEQFWENQKLFKDVENYMLSLNFKEAYRYDYDGQCDVVWFNNN